MKKLLSIILALTLIAVIPLTAFAERMLIGDVNNDGKVTAADARIVLRIAAGLEDSKGYVNIADAEPSTDEDVYKIGDTWRVAGQWELTITGVEKTEVRNEYEEKQPEAVYIVSYTYKNLGYQDEYSDGLFFSIDGELVDNGGKMGYTYPLSVDYYPTETPVGAYCEAQEVFGVDNAGTFKLYIDKYDDSSNKHSAVFEIEVN